MSDSIDQATLAQLDATDPAASTWLSANAGSGKTRVLTNRVALLLFRGVDPNHILCLTYTKAAASEMKNRLFKQLGEWAMMPDAKLGAQLQGLGIKEALKPEDLARARQLFALAIEAPGGLRIQTIHSFCGGLLRQFPLEAGISPLFREMDDRANFAAFDRIIESMSLGPDSRLLETISTYLSDNDFHDLCRDVASMRKAFSVEETREDVFKRMHLAPDASQDRIVNRLFSEAHCKLLARVRQVLAQSTGKNDPKAAAKLDTIPLDAPRIADLHTLFDVCLKKSFEAKTAGHGQLMNGDSRTENPVLATELDDFLRYVEAQRAEFMTLQLAEQTLAVAAFARRFLHLYETVKSDHGWLDFDDLIEKATRLLQNPQVAQWVMYRLDGGIDHLLVDEAQDTSPNQWQLVRLLTQEFWREADSQTRTVFVVGDKKQSIYSFQGADPAEFDENRDYYGTILGDVQKKLHVRNLRHSFRSSPAILQAVDAAFTDDTQAGFTDMAHAPSYPAMAGRVDLWPIVDQQEKPEEVDWFDPAPVDVSNKDCVELAGMIAGKLREMVDRAQIIDKDGAVRRVDEGDILILVRRRSELFHELISACKRAGLQIAGSDRLKVGGELAVRDLRALLNFLSLMQDDLSLAAALRSPLFGFSEQDLFTLAHHRTEKHLWPALERQKSDHRTTYDILRDLRDKSDYLPPYELLERILVHHGGRMRLLDRLGSEAAEGIDALLALARQFDETEPANLTGFLEWLDQIETEKKRQPEIQDRRIQVMTTHGAKGLERPIVVLPDTTEAREQTRLRIRLDPDGKPFWPSRSAEAAPFQKRAQEEEARKAEEERLRLLYVAMTRAEKWLILCGSGKTADREKAWYRRLRNMMESTNAAQIETPAGPGLRLSHGIWPDDLAPRQIAAAADLDTLDPWLQTPPRPAPRQKRFLTPSDLSDEKTLPGMHPGSGEMARVRGLAIHRLLELLPDYQGDERPRIGAAILQSQFPELDEGMQTDCLRIATACIEHPDFAHIFAPDTLAEVTIGGPLHDPAAGHIRGQIDRLIITPDRVLIVDFKTNAVVPTCPNDTPEGILLQMAAYMVAVQQIYADREVEAAILWTETPSLMKLPQDLLIPQTRNISSP